MRKMNLFLGFLILLAGHAASAKADPVCGTCADLNQLSVKLRNNAPEALDQAIVAVGRLAMGPKKILSPVEADAFVDLMMLMLKADRKQNGGDAAAQLFNAWKRNAQVMDRAVAKRTPDELSYLQKERARGRKLMSEGNG